MLADIMRGKKPCYAFHRMFGTDLDRLELSEIVSFLETGVREGVALEFKKDFPNHLEKTLASFANTYGGFLLIGVDETSTGAAALPIGGVELRPGLRDRQQGIAINCQRELYWAFGFDAPDTWIKSDFHIV
jgi:hypothetical protein